jgi:hypothetical protein
MHATASVKNNVRTRFGGKREVTVVILAINAEAGGRSDNYTRSRVPDNEGAGQEANDVVGRIVERLEDDVHSHLELVTQFDVGGRGKHRTLIQELDLRFSSDALSPKVP